MEIKIKQITPMEVIQLTRMFRKMGIKNTIKPMIQGLYKTTNKIEKVNREFGQRILREVGNPHKEGLSEEEKEKIYEQIRERNPELEKVVEPLEDQKADLAIELMMEILEQLDTAEEAYKELLARIAGITVEELEQMTTEDWMKFIGQFMEQGGFQSFFSLLGRLMNLR